MRKLKGYIWLNYNKLVMRFLLPFLYKNGSKKSIGNFVVMGWEERYLNDFYFSLEESLDILEKIRTNDFKIVKENIKFFICSSKKSPHLALYSCSSCSFMEDHWRDYPISIRSKIMAAVIVHEAYHGEYQRLYGAIAYGRNPRYEKMCREHEVEVLRHFRAQSNEEDQHLLDERIDYLETLIHAQQSA